VPVLSEAAEVPGVVKPRPEERLLAAEAAGVVATPKSVC
jgi:hypothetical protein